MLKKTLGFLIGACVLLTACDLEQISTETEPPTVVDIEPEEGATNVPIEKRIQVVFSEKIPSQAVRSDRFEVKFVENDSLERGSYEVVDRTATFIPQDDSVLESNVRYRVTVDSISDMQGNKMQGQRTWEFTTVDVPPEIVSVYPSDGASGVPLDTTISVQFSEPVDEQTVNEETFEVVFAENDSLESGNYTVNGSTAIFTPAEDSLDNNASYRVTVSGVADQGGNEVQETRTWEFATTDTTSSN